MSRDPQRLPDYFGHILEAIERIQSYVEDVGEAGFLSSKIIQDAVIRNLEDKTRTAQQFWLVDVLIDKKAALGRLSF